MIIEAKEKFFLILEKFSEENSKMFGMLIRYLKTYSEVLEKKGAVCSDIANEISFFYHTHSVI